MKRFRDTDYFVDEWGNVYRNGKVRRGSFNKKNGYRQITLWKDGIVKSFYIHRMVAELYVENFSIDLVVNHKNGKKTDNHYSNLEWISHTENVKHAIENGLMNTRGENNPMCKITNDVVDEIRRTYVKNSRTLGSTSLSKEYGISFQQIIRIVNKQRRGH